MSMSRIPAQGILFFALGVGVLTSCTARLFDKGDKSQEEFARDRAECTQESRRWTPVRYGRIQYTDWDAYVRCMSSRGYPSGE